MNKSLKNKLAYFISFAVIGLAFTSCEKDKEDPIIETRIVEKDVPRYNATINFIEKANGNEVVFNTNNKPYQNEKGQSFNISKLRYLISDITFHKLDGSSFTIDDYHLVDNSIDETASYAPKIKVPAGDYAYISFTFGFDKMDNQTGIYTDLNLANWAWPQNLGGGYHFMQLEGNYDSSGVSKAFATHMGTARNNTVSPTIYETNHFEAHLDSSAIKVNGDFQFDIVMNVEQWYENPYQWDFVMYNTGIMMNYDAQRKLNINGSSVFSYQKFEIAE